MLPRIELKALSLSVLVRILTRLLDHINVTSGEMFLGHFLPDLDIAAVHRILCSKNHFLIT